MGYVEEMRALVGRRPLLLVAAGVVVRDGDGRILLQRRSDDDLWGLVGGALEPGESLEDAARRELREETALVAGRLTPIDVYSGAEFHLRYPNGDEAYVVGATFLAAEVTGEPRADGLEGTELGWFAVTDLPAMGDYNRRLLARFVARLGADAGSWGPDENGWPSGHRRADNH
jgi:8-oxo-dGTP pyrophosphatase MutT (NUDIX family)